MPRTIEAIVPPEKTDAVIERMRRLDSVAGISVQRRASVQPRGDIVTLQATNDGTRAALDALADLGVTEGGSILTSEPRSLISPPYQGGIDRESNETVWDEMAFLLRRDSNVSVNYLAVMGLAGAVAAVGLWTNTVHVVVGAMLLAPGFEPLLRIPFALISGPRDLLTGGLRSSAYGYLLLALGAALTLLVLRLVDPGAAPELESRSWVRYWSSLTPPSVVLSVLAAAAGAVVITAQRSVLSSGVMIALALVPGMSIAGMALVSGEFWLAAQGLGRWAVDAASVVVVSAAVLGLKQAFIHKRRALG